VSGSLAVGLYLAAAAAVALAAAWVRRPIPKGVFALFALLPFAFFFPDIVLDGTRLPTDQTYLFAAAAAHPTGPRNPWLNDVAIQILPWAVKVREAWRAGEAPLRDFWNGCGSPLAAGGQPGAFSPLSLFAVLLPLSRAFGVAAAVKGLAALAGMWLWLRELRASSPAALFGAVSFALSFSIVPWVFFPIAAAIAVWPWVFFAVERLRDAQSEGRAFFLLVAVFAIWPLLGHAESVVSGLALLAVVLAVRRASGDLPDAPRLLTRAILAGLAGAGLCAFAVLPQALAILASNRRALAAVPLYAPHFSWIPHGFIWPGWRTTLFARAFGDGIESPMLPISGAAFPEMALGYVGVVGWAVALLVLRPGSRRARITGSLVAALAVALGIGLGAWPFAEIAGHLPVLRWMLPVRILSWIALAASTLAALELDRWLRDAESGPWRAALAVSSAAAVLALLAGDTQKRYYLALGPPAGFPAQVAALELTLWCLAALAVSAALVLAKPAAVRRAVPYLFVLVTGTELTIQALRQYRVGPAGDIFPASPLAEFLHSRPGAFRVVGEGWEFFPQRNVFAGVEDVRTHDPVERRDYVEFLDATCGYAPADYFKHVVNMNAPALDFLNVRYMVSFPGRGSSVAKWRPAYSGPDGTVLENQDVLPRVFAPRRIAGVLGSAPRGWVENASRPFRDALPQIARLADFREKAFVLGEPAGERGNNEAQISGYAESGRHATFRSRAADSTILVASLVQDGGWQARDEAGRRLPTTLANGPFLAVTVPAGDHFVVLDYAPPGWRPGLALSLATAVVLGAALVRRLSAAAVALRPAAENF
jgi:hypothetical protein